MHARICLFSSLLQTEELRSSTISAGISISAVTTAAAFARSTVGIHSRIAVSAGEPRCTHAAPSPQQHQLQPESPASQLSNSNLSSSIGIGIASPPSRGSVSTRSTAAIVGSGGRGRRPQASRCVPVRRSARLHALLPSSMLQGEGPRSSTISSIRPSNSAASSSASSSTSSAAQQVRRSHCCRHCRAIAAAAASIIIL